MSCEARTSLSTTTGRAWRTSAPQNTAPNSWFSGTGGIFFPLNLTNIYASSPNRFTLSFLTNFRANPINHKEKYCLRYSIVSCLGYTLSNNTKSGTSTEDQVILHQSQLISFFFSFYCCSTLLRSSSQNHSDNNTRPKIQILLNSQRASANCDGKAYLQIIFSPETICRKVGLLKDAPS